MEHYKKILDRLVDVKRSLYAIEAAAKNIGLIDEDDNDAKNIQNAIDDMIINIVIDNAE